VTTTSDSPIPPLEPWYGEQVRKFEKRLQPLGADLALALSAQAELILAVMRHDMNNLTMVVRGEQDIAKQTEQAVSNLKKEFALFTEESLTDRRELRALYERHERAIAQLRKALKALQEEDEEVQDEPGHPW
jgi:predicted HD phosphohydrolase